MGAESRLGMMGDVMGVESSWFVSISTMGMMGDVIGAVGGEEGVQVSMIKILEDMRV